MGEEQPSVTDLLAGMQIIMERFGRGERLALDGDRDSVLVLASAVLAVAGELRDIHNVLHEINMKMALRSE